MSFRTLNIAWWAAFIVSLSVAVKAGAACYELVQDHCRDEFCACFSYDVGQCEVAHQTPVIWISCTTDVSTHQLSPVGSAEGYNPSVVLNEPEGCGNVRYVPPGPVQKCVVVKLQGQRRCVCDQNPGPMDWTVNQQVWCGRELYGECGN
jgi:hypothetical protein